MEVADDEVLGDAELVLEVLSVVAKTCVLDDDELDVIDVSAV